jgi:hypothetical protein
MITNTVFINEIDTLYEFDDSDLFKLVHTNMHLHIDLCLCDMTQEELDAFINYPHDKRIVISNFDNFLYIAIHVEFLWILCLFLFNLLKLQYYFIIIQDNKIIINNVIIYVGGLYASYSIGYKLGKPLIIIMTNIIDRIVSFWK